MGRGADVAPIGALAACVAALVSCSPTPPSPKPSPLVRASGAPSPTSSASGVAGAEPARPRPPTFASSETFTLLVRGGDVVDGTGAPRRRADVVVRGDRIVFVGDVAPEVRAERIVDATGAIVTPGFIDMHSHADPKGDVEPALAQGVTTIVVGQDGASPSRHIGAWLDEVDRGRPRVNVATLVGHGTARNAAGLGSKAHLRPEERASLAEIIDVGLREGAFGLSTGLEYDPGRFADADELAAAAKPVGARGGVVMSHLRSENDDEIDAAIAELVEQGRESGARVHIAHLKVVCGHGVARADALLEQLAAARARGIDVTADMYPYDASYTTIGILFPKRPGSEADVLAYLKARVEKRNGPEATLFGSGPYAGKTLAEAAASRGVPFERILFDLGPSGATAAYFVMDDALETRLFLDPFVSVGTDGGGGDPHPRSHGTFARVFAELVEKRHALSVEEAVRKMTGLAAQTLGLDGDRGCLAPGCAADLDVFVPSELRTRADFLSPRVLAEGMRAVIVNGLVERAGAEPTRARSGRALRAKARAATDVSARAGASTR